MARPKKSKPTSPNFDAQRKDVVVERTKLENQLQKAQEKLRTFDRQKDADKYSEALQPVNDLKQRIGRISQEHVELARMVSAMKGGKNHIPPA